MVSSSEFITCVKILGGSHMAFPRQERSGICIRVFDENDLPVVLAVFVDDRLDELYYHKADSDRAGDATDFMFFRLECAIEYGVFFTEFEYRYFELKAKCAVLEDLVSKHIYRLLHPRAGRKPIRGRNVRRLLKTKLKIEAEKRRSARVKNKI